MPNLVHAFQLEKENPSFAGRSCLAIFGPDAFLRRISLNSILKNLNITSDDYLVSDGESCEWRDVHDELSTVSLFDSGGTRRVIVHSADNFVSRNRASLENWLESPSANALLILDIQTLAANTKIYKLVQKHGFLVDCRSPTLGTSSKSIDEKTICRWAADWANSRYQLKLSDRQARLLIERIGDVYGLIDCELAKLDLFKDEKGTVSDERVHELVGGWRTKTVWEIADAIADGKTSVALEQLEQLFSSGQAPIAISAQMAWSLRRLGLAATLAHLDLKQSKPLNLNDALQRAGIFRNTAPSAERALRRIGSQRALQILNWLRELDAKLKGSHSSDDRAKLALEEFILRLR